MNLSDFPASYKALINQSTSHAKKYIHATEGSDSNDGNSLSTPYATLEYAETQCLNISTPVMYIIGPGTYALSPRTHKTSNYGLLTETGIKDNGNPRIYLCAAKKTIITHGVPGVGSSRDISIGNLENSNSAIYGAILKRNNNGRTNSYSTAFIQWNSNGSFNNCVFEEVNANNVWTTQYDYGAGASSAINNCTIFVGAAGLADYTGEAGVSYNSCVFKYTYGSGSSIKTNPVINTNIDSITYVTTGVPDAGVWSGTHQWENISIFVEDSNGDQVSNLLEGQTYTFNYVAPAGVSDGNVSYYIYGVDSTDINGASLTGTISVSGGVGSLSLTTSADMSASEGIETFVLSINGEYVEPADPTIKFIVLNLFDNSAVIATTPIEGTTTLGSNVTFTLYTSGLANGSLVPYTLSNVTSAQVGGASLTGNFVITNNQGTLVVTTNGVLNKNLTITSYSGSASVFVSFIGSLDDDIVLNQYNNSIFTIQDIPVQMNIDHFGGPDYTLDAGLLIKDVANIDFNNSAEKVSRRLMTELDGQINTYVIPAMGEIKREYWF